MTKCLVSGGGGKLGSLLLNLVDVANHVESSLREVIIITSNKTLECGDGLLKGHELSRGASEHLSNVERLRHELLDLTGAGNGELVVLRQLIHTKDGNDILKILVILEGLLDLTGELVVLLSNNTGVEHTGGGVKRVNSRVDSQLSDTAGQHGSSVQMSECGGRGRIGQIISGHVDGLHGGDRSLLVGGDTLLEATQIGSEGRLISDSGWDTSKKSGHLGVGLGEAEDIVNEKKHVLALLITEIFGNSQTGEGNTSAGTRGLVHLSVHKGCLGSSALKLDHT
mmetsp:Transcript_48813/g.76186  ORF Transcript_48813/g.76186 Transcript_48813/m.76186 type:complete len:282 (+) Transcript_48813:149-994(+)